MGFLWEGLVWVWAWVWAGPGSGLRLLRLSLAPPGYGGWPGYASVPGPEPGSGPGPGLGPVRALLTVVLAWTRWSSLAGPHWKVLNKFPWVRACPLDP